MLPNLTELEERGLTYIERSVLDYVTYEEFHEEYFKEESNCVADVGTSQFLMLR